MPDNIPTFQRIVIAAHPQLPEAAEEAIQVAAFLQKRGVLVAQGLLYDETLRGRIKEGEFDLMIALGGDGTMLRAGHLCAPIGLPILGINLGGFGFLTEIKQDQWRTTLPRLFEGGFRLEKRMLLRGEHWRLGQLLDTWEVLNEIVVSRGQIVRPIHLITSVDGRYLTTYVADA
jgi:NAD+ kinase